MKLSEYPTKDIVTELRKRKDVVGMEDAKWLSPERGRGKISESRKLLESIEVGEVKRLYHYDISCHKRDIGGWQCHLAGARDVLKKKGLEFRIYHEDEHIAIVTRTK